MVRSMLTTSSSNRAHSDARAIFTLPPSNELKISSSGSGDLDELEDQFDDARIQFGFIRVQDKSNGLTKFVLVNWVSLLAMRTSAG